MKIGVIGGGIVGRATARTWLEHAEVRVHDIIKERSTHSFYETMLSDIIFICLPEDALDEFFCFRGWSQEPQEQFQSRNFVLKSTVPVGTTRRLAKDHLLNSIVHSPEFLTARCAMVDAQMPARNIIGRVTHDGVENACSWLLYQLYKDRFPSVPVLTMTPEESETVKLAINSFFTVKVGYFTIIKELCDKVGMDWSTVKQGILSDGRIAHAHTKVPGPDGKPGFGGLCLPKDLDHLIVCLESEGIPALPLRAIQEANRKQRKE